MARHEEIAGRILDYITTRPEKEYTLDGIINWWMRSNEGEKMITLIYALKKVKTLIF